MASFTEHDLKPVPLVELQEAAHILEIAQYGKKVDIAARIVSSKGGKGILNKLISTSLKKVKEKKATNPVNGPKATFMKKERARLVASGVTHKNKINEELKRLWTMYQSTSTPLKTIIKKNTSVKKANVAEKFINSSKLLPDSVCKARNLTLVGSDSSTGKTVYKYKVKKISTPAKGSPKAKKDDDDDANDDDANDDSDDDFDDACAEVEERAISRIKSKKIKREHINGFLEAFGVDASGWTLPHAKEEIVVQLLNETDDENSDDEEEDDDDDEKCDEEDDDE
jgi:hypothetical protein